MVGEKFGVRGSGKNWIPSFEGMTKGVGMTNVRQDLRFEI